MARTSALLAAVIVVGCSRDVRLSGRNIRSVTVRPVTHYGLTLDQNATPEQVAYVALRAIREDVEAGTDAAKREAALDIQFDVCAANKIQERNKGSTPRDEWIHSVVYHWAPTVSHYAADFETDWEKAKSRLILFPSKASSVSTSSSEALVAMTVNDPSGNPNASAVLMVLLQKDGGMWRIMHFGFEVGSRSRPATKSIGKTESPDSSTQDDA